MPTRIVAIVAAVLLLTAAVPGLAAAHITGEATPRLTLAALAAPQLQSPADGQRLQNLGPITLAWDLPAGSTQYHLQVFPYGGDGPGIDLIRNAEGSFLIPGPPSWYVILPAMTYEWRVRATDNPGSVSSSDPSWGAWSERRTFQTPAPSAAGIRPLAPPQGATATSLTPALIWGDASASLFYYEIQVSEDQTFNMDPATATAAVYWNLVHGGQSDPPNSWAIPTDYPLTPGARYYWRVRPRVQGDGVPVDWSQLFFFTTPGAATPPPAPAPTPSPTPAPAVAGCNWTGIWHTFGFSDMYLVQDGTRVYGIYDEGEGRVDGTVTGAQFMGRWQESTTEGGLILNIAANCNSFSGTYGTGMGYGPYVVTGNRTSNTVPPGSVPSPGGATPPAATPTPAPAVAGCNWTGIWHTFGFSDMYLVQDGTRVYGIYNEGQGRVDGTVTGAQFMGRWQEATTEGGLILNIAANCNSFSGTYGTGMGYGPYIVTGNRTSNTVPPGSVPAP